MTYYSPNKYFVTIDPEGVIPATLTASGAQYSWQEIAKLYGENSLLRKASNEEVVTKAAAEDVWALLADIILAHLTTPYTQDQQKLIFAGQPVPGFARNFIRVMKIPVGSPVAEALLKAEAESVGVAPREPESRSRPDPSSLIDEAIAFPDVQDTASQPKPGDAASAASSTSSIPPADSLEAANEDFELPEENDGVAAGWPRPSGNDETFVERLLAEDIKGSLAIDLEERAKLIRQLNPEAMKRLLEQRKQQKPGEEKVDAASQGQIRR